MRNFDYLAYKRFKETSKKRTSVWSVGSEDLNWSGNAHKIDNMPL